VEFDGRDITRLNARGAANSASRTFPKTGTGAGCCSIRPRGKFHSRRALPLAGRRQRVFELDGIARAPRKSSTISTCARRIRICRRNLSPAATSRNSSSARIRLNPKLLLVSQPTRGVDIGAIEFIHRKLVALRDAGCAVLLVSAELEEVTALADRLLVIYKGKFVGEVDPKSATHEEIGLLMTGGKVSPNRSSRARRSRFKSKDKESTFRRTPRSSSSTSARKTITSSKSRSNGKANLKISRTALFVVLFVFVFSFEINRQPETDKIIDQQNAVRDGENPVADQITVDRKADRRENLPDEQQVRDAFARAFLVLFVNLPDQSREKND
jgi:hypothetical protein